MTVALLQKRKLLLHERIGLTSVGEAYEFIDPADGRVLGRAAEDLCPGGIIARLFLDRSFLNIRVVIDDEAGKPLFVLQSPAAPCCRPVFLRDAQDALLAVFRPKFRLFGCAVEVTDADGKALGSIAGDVRRRTFTLTGGDGRVIGEIGHRVDSWLKDLFTSADNYQLRLLGDQQQAGLFLATAVVVDLLYHED